MILNKQLGYHSYQMSAAVVKCSTNVSLSLAVFQRNLDRPVPLGSSSSTCSRENPDDKCNDVLLTNQPSMSMQGRTESNSQWPGRPHPFFIHRYETSDL